MADERNRWLDRAASERVLRGAPASAGDADPRAREAEARLRAALDVLVPPPAPPGAELPGEAAAVAAFRAARGAAGAPAAAEPSAAAGAALPLVELGRTPSAAVPAQARASAGGRRGSRPARFALAAALAGVAVGGLAAAAGAGLLDRITHDTAGPAPAVSLSADEDPAHTGETVRPSSPPQLVPSPFRGDGFAPSGTPATPGGEAGAGRGGGVEPGLGAGGTGTAPDTATGGSTRGTGKETLGGATELLERERETRRKAVDLCQAYRSGQMNPDRRDRLSRLAQGIAKIPHYCETLLDGPGDSGGGGSTAPRDSAEPGAVVKTPRLGQAPAERPALPGPTASAAVPTFR
ncbi:MULTISPECIES: hypothetical protein [Streptomyces]|uniref:hypothetical protein n=1 Tax=Streptomyces TaxID=1883 RepID=UPI0016775C31|nr:MULTISPECIES: hypothetical protein [Streptomyces]MBD3576386.1 hypothetical protein [Streptomyces sp. KD18]GGS87897.1 hypothetical protein GCM10010286_10750 [Streptomyces toxytricini]